MTQFCENCPMEGRTGGDVGHVTFRAYESGHTFFGIEVKDEEYVVGVVVDIEGNPSQPFNKGEQDENTVLTRIKNCPGVQHHEVERLFRKQKEIVDHCPALGRLALGNNTDIYRLVARDVGL